MGYISLLNVKRELLNLLRNSDVFSTTTRSVTTYTDNFTATGGAETFTLTKTICRNIRSVKVNSTAINFGKDYTLNYTNNNIVSVSITTLSVSDSVAIEYDYKATSGSKIYPDYPRQDLTISQYPRMGFDYSDYTKDTAGFGNVNVSNIDFIIKILAVTTQDCDEYLDTLNQYIINNQNTLYYLDHIKPIEITPAEPVSIRANNKVFQVSMRVRARNNYEIN
ncbi:MAG: hypothetical protein EOL95_10475 [Bacteroidia bacterium]|nr:hypothetical protein [Bacteroidia bacterium]